MLLVTADELAARRLAAAGPLRPLATSLAADLAPLVNADPFIPHEKALLSRDGGRCAHDGTLLEFDPWTPRQHRCPACGVVYTGEAHFRFWIYWYQLWLAERAVHGALLAALGWGDAYRQLAHRILERYVELYPAYPNRDNVLGPTRPFFSTYLESIWMLQLCVAVDLLEHGSATADGGGPSASRDLAGRVRDRIIQPSRAIIQEYDEGASNRQVWNNAALLASALLLGRVNDAERVAYGETGVAFHLGSGLLGDGTWYEGENYHLFAHRGLWYGVTMCERAGLELPDTLVARFQEAFATPFLTALPDLTLPARRDSQYAISLRQWRFAELCELGLARDEDRRLLAALARIYAADDTPARDTGRSRSAADVERNYPPTRLSRADLGWRSLLHARPELPPLESLTPESALLPSQGIAVFRRQDAEIYVALDYGHSGGGHGHPDRLDVLLSQGATRWLDDMGTGSYVDPSLHWYRSTLAHDAPLVGGRSQARVDGALLAHDERGDAGWVSAEARDIAPGVSLRRTLVVMSDYVVDELAWTAEGAVTLDLPIHLVSDLVSGGGAPRRAELRGGGDPEDGFAYVRDAWVRDLAAAEPVELHAVDGERSLRMWLQADGPAELWRATAPGPPGTTGARPFWLLRAAGASGTIRSVWAWTAVVRGATLGAAPSVELLDGTRHDHVPTADGWRIVMRSGDDRRQVELAGLVLAVTDETEVPRPVEETLTWSRSIRRGELLHARLGSESYRRSEETWEEAGRPGALLTIGWTGDELVVEIDITKHGPLTFTAPDAANPYDNEPADVNGDGVQLYLTTPVGDGAWMLVPETGAPSAPLAPVRVRPLAGWVTTRRIEATWTRAPNGYRVHVTIPLADLPPARRGREVGLDVIINEKPPGRERRRGQLVLSGGFGEFVYLRGDRQDRDRLLRFELVG